MKDDQKTGTQQYAVADILKGSLYALTIFTDAEVKALKLFEKGGKPYLTCAASDKPRPAKPEEIVRQLYLRKLIDHYGYSKERIAIEKSAGPPLRLRDSPSWPCVDSGAPCARSPRRSV